jgi:hypothetical protein
MPLCACRKALRLALCLVLVSSIVFGFSRDGTIHAAQGAEGTVTATVAANPLIVSVSAPEQVLVHESFWIEAQVRNTGDARMAKTVGTLHVPEGLTVMTKAERNIGAIQSQREKVVRWRVRGDEPGTYIILVVASGEYQGALIEAQSTVAVEVVESRSWLFSLLAYLGLSSHYKGTPY